MVRIRVCVRILEPKAWVWSVGFDLSVSSEYECWAKSHDTHRTS